jgi:hypothetical protein
VDAGFKERVTAAFDGLAARAPDGSLRRGLGFCYTRAATA